VDGLSTLLGPFEPAARGYVRPMGHVLDGILKLPPLIALALVFLLPAVEASIFVGVVVPGEIGVILGGVLANQHKLPLAAVLAAGILGAIIGDSIGYVVGDKYGERLLNKLPDRLLKPEHIEKSEESIRRLGGKAVFVGRFTAALRALIPGLAGMGRMPYRKFLAWNALGGALWASGFVILGYLAGSQYQRIERYANYIGLALLAAIATYFLFRWRRSKHNGTGPRHQPESQRPAADHPSR
jgi:membrane-associated protein